MRKIIALLIFFTVSFGYAQDPATFTVEVPMGTQSVRMTGLFWGWNPIEGPVASDNGDNTWTVTLFAGGGDSQLNMEYKWVIVILYVCHRSNLQIIRFRIVLRMHVKQLKLEI